MEIVVNGHSVGLSLTIGIYLLAVLLNAYLFGVVSQQFYTYWRCGFEDSKRVKVFVITQFTVVAFQSVMLWHMTWTIFIADYGLPLEPLGLSYSAWKSLIQSACGDVLVLSANVFLAIRIHSLTNSRLQRGLVLAFSTSAFVLAIVTTVMTWDSSLTSSFLATLNLSTTQNVISVVWHGLQAIAECLITVFLARALLKSRSGIQKSDGVVNYLIRQVVQIGFLATLWAIAGLGTWFLLPRTALYVLFDATAGPMYTHVIFDTLLSRVRLRERMANTTHIEIMFSQESQAKSDIHEGQRGLSVSNGPNGAVSVMTTPNLRLAAVDAPRLRGALEHDDSEIKSAPVGLPMSSHFHPIRRTMSMEIPVNHEFSTRW
ncbi:hypothetical protein BJV78DRAFT_221943 [Lactifluus subvellereus]|nr:hypothetical protein BJV78DRAFT_221943 [Lactifluus subvellereus]